jgi:peptidoglycan/LPS O-acetylase OafA/YrhL
MKEHLKGLDSLRAIAALIVVFSHLELLKGQNHIENIFEVVPSGHIGVILFFVLSGFLISFLLMKELEINQKISFRNFYMRRILRIWPLYYLIIILSFLLNESSNSTMSYLLCITIFPNVAHAIGEGWASSPQIWSIGVEEQFYLIWPIILSMIFTFRKKLLPIILISFILIFTLLPHALGFINVRFFQSEYMLTIERFFYGTKYNCLAIGAFIGIAYANRKKWVNLLNNNFIFIPITIITLLMWGFNVVFVHFNDEVFAILFALLILGAIGSETIKIDTNISKFLGKISYGIYMYHWLIIILVMKFLPFQENTSFYNLKLYFLVFGLTIFVSWFSFVFFEKKFLKLKIKYRINKATNKT